MTRLVWCSIGLTLSCSLQGSSVSPLYIRGHAVIPEPQKIELKSSDFAVDDAWRLQAPPGDTTAEILNGELAERYHLKFTHGSSGKVVELAIHPGAVEVGQATDRNKGALAEQAYQLDLSPEKIRVLANAAPGLFYGVETLVQLVRPDGGKLWLPEGEIVDWPDVGLREVFWDEQEHLDHFDVLKQAIRRAAFFKANAFVLRLNGHFEYRSAAALVDPYALTAAQLQELTDYGLRYHIEVIPYLDGPAHVNFILERDEYANLREFPETAFEMCSTNPDTYKLLEGMYQDLIDANKGVKYFHLSTDEAWFIGKADNAQCREAEHAKELGSPSRLWVEFTQKTTKYLEDHGRKVIFWGEDPLQAEDIALLPPSLINGEVYSPSYNKAFRARGISQMIYTNTLPDDPLFPFYYVLAPGEQIHSRDVAADRATQAFNELSYTAARQEADITGTGIYAWADLGPHPETYWLGYAVAASAAWHPGASDPQELAHRFYQLFYGRGAIQMGRLYQLMSTQAQFWASSWDSQPSGNLPLIFGYSYGIGPFVPHITTVALPPIPSTDYLRLGNNWRQENTRRLELAGKFLAENDELLNLLYTNLSSVEFNRHNLEVYLSIAEVFRQNLSMFKSLEEICGNLEKAQGHAGKLQSSDAVAALDQTLDGAQRIRDLRNQVLADLTATWYRTFYPRVREANGRHVARAPQSFVDTKPSEAAYRRQEGLLYVMERVFALPFGEWVNQLRAVRNTYAEAHHLLRRDATFDWQDTKTLRSTAVDREL